MGDNPGTPGIGTQKLEYDKGITTKPGYWFESATPPTSLSERLKKRSQFTLQTTVATDDPNQKGTARIISLSKDANNRNFTLAQDGRDLVFRLRTPITGENGARPELRVPGVFSNMDRKKISIAYDGSSLFAYVNGVRRSAAYELTPGYVALTYLPIRYSVTDMRIYRLFYYFMVLVPMGVMIQLTSKSIGVTRGKTVTAIVTLILFSSAALETILVSVTGKPFDYANMLLAVVSSGSGALLWDCSRQTTRFAQGPHMNQPA
jgi:hypothetical protein